MPKTSAQSVSSERIPLDTISTSILLIGTLLGRTWRYKISGSNWVDPFNDAGKGVIYCFWHSQILPLTYIFRNTGKFALISESDDGKRAAAVAQRWKHGVVVGSSTRGGSFALRQCVHLVKNCNSIVVTPDGPRGPREIVKPGVAQIALLAGAPVVTVSAHAHNVWRLRSWDRLMIPKPFAFLDIVISDPLFPDGENADNLTKQIQERLTS